MSTNENEIRENESDILDTADELENDDLDEEIEEMMEDVDLQYDENEFEDLEEED